MGATEGAPTKFCQTCGEQIHEDAVICPECGVEQPKKKSSSPTSFVEAYPIWAWLAGVVLSIIALGWGLIPLAYFVLKGSQDDFEGQSTAEILTVLLFSLLGIVIVEVWGDSGATTFWKVIAILVAGFILLIIFGIVIGLLATGL